MSNERNDRGRFVERFGLDDVLGVLASVDEPLTAGEVGEAFGVSNRAALNKLDELYEQGTVERKKVGGRSVVWWLSDDAALFDTDDDHDPDGPFFGAPVLDAEDGEPIDATATDDLLGDALADEADG